MVACSICDEPYDVEKRIPLWLACCKSIHLCEECIKQHLKMGTNKCIICPSRTSVRNFLAQCQRATPATLLNDLRKKEVMQEEEELRNKPRPLELGKAGLLEEYAKARGIERDGDAHAALKLQMLIEAEERQEAKKTEERDLQMARRLQEMEDRDKQMLKERLTKAPNLSGIAQHGRANARIHRQGSLTLHSYFQSKSKRRDGEDEGGLEQSTDRERGSKKTRRDASDTDEVIVLSP